MALLIDGVAVVTGAGSGIGRECALAYAAEGARGVVLADRNYDTALEAAHESELIATHQTYKAVAVAVDVSDGASVDEMVKAAVRAFGRIDYSVNSAGVGVQKHLPVEDADAAEMNRFWQVNVMGTFNCVQAMTKVMKEQSVATVSSRGRAREVGRGVILNLGSCNSYIATRDIVQYTTTKHAVMGLTKNAGELFFFSLPKYFEHVGRLTMICKSAGQRRSRHPSQRHLPQLGRNPHGRRRNGRQPAPGEDDPGHHPHVAHRPAGGDRRRGPLHDESAVQLRDRGRLDRGWWHDVAGSDLLGEITK